MSMRPSDARQAPHAGPDSAEPVAWPDDAVEVGKVVGAFGVKGWIRVQPYAAGAPEALFSSRRWFLRPAPARVPATAAVPVPGVLRVTEAREHGDTVVATAKELPDRSAAEALKGATVHVPRSSFPTPADGEYYWVDLIGCEVINRDGLVLGQVADLLDTGPHCVLQVQPARADGADAVPDLVLIPFVEAYLDEVDLGARRIRVDWSVDF